MAACRDALDNTSAQDMWAAHCSEYLFISIVENKDDLLMFFFTEFNLQMYLVNTIYKSGMAVTRESRAAHIYHKLSGQDAEVPIPPVQSRLASPDCLAWV